MKRSCRGTQALAKPAKQAKQMCERVKSEIGDLKNQQRLWEKQIADAKQSAMGDAGEEERGSSSPQRLVAVEVAALLPASRLSAKQMYTLGTPDRRRPPRTQVVSVRNHVITFVEFLPRVGRILSSPPGQPHAHFVAGR